MTVVRRCLQCQSIDPVPINHQPEEIQVSENWQRLAINVNHYRGTQYLTMVDCEPSGFVIWREMITVTEYDFAKILNGIFLERSLVEVSMNNRIVFRSETMREML